MSEEKPESLNPTPIESAADLTRREWLLRLGEFVTLAGFSGFIPEVAVRLAAAQAAGQPNLTSLPPGLYDPSQEHLVHVLSSGGKAWAPPPGSETEYVESVAHPFRFQFFTHEEVPVVTRLLSVLLGSIDETALTQVTQWIDLYLFSAVDVRAAAKNLDPMHRVLAVAYYGEDSVRELETADPQGIARAGLQALRDLSRKTYGGDFLKLTAEQQSELLTAASKLKPASDLRRLFDLTRTEAIRGYYTTAKGLTELDYRGNAYYTESPGCEGKS